MIAMRCIPSRWIPLFSKLSSLPVMAPHRISLEAALRYMVTQLLLVPILMTTPEGQMLARLTYLYAVALPGLSKPSSLPVMALHPISLDSALRYMATQHLLAPRWMTTPEGQMLARPTYLYAVALSGLSKPNSLPVMVRPRIS